MDKEKDRLIKELEALKKAYADLENRYREHKQVFSEASLRKEETLEALSMADTIIDRSPVVLFRRMAGDDPKLIYVSNNVRQLGYTAEEFLSGKIHFKDIVHPEDGERVGGEISRYVEENIEEYTQFYRFVTRSGEVRWVEDQTSVIRDAGGNKAYHQGIVVDITERKLAENKLARSEEKFRRIVETTGEGFLLMDEHLKILDVNQAYCGMLGYDREELVGKTPLDLATDEFRQFMVTGWERIMAMDYRKLEGKVVAKDGRVVPVLIHGNTLRDDSGAKMGNVAFVTDLTEQKKALALAGQIQRSLAPRMTPEVAGFDIAGRSDVCDEVGGDYYDFLFGKEYGSDKLKVVVGDISGHGVDAALLMTSARTFMRMRAAQAGGPAQIVSSMNQHLSPDMEDTGHFMTLFFMEIDPGNGTANWVRAGHDPALIYHPKEDLFEELVGTGLPLGVDKAFKYEEYALSHLRPGTVIALVTDGIWESVNAKGEMFGKKRLNRLIKEHAGESSKEIVDHVFNELSGFTKGLPRQDDLTMVVIKAV